MPEYRYENPSGYVTAVIFLLRLTLLLERCFNASVTKQRIEFYDSAVTLLEQYVKFFERCKVFDKGTLNYY